MGLRIGDGAEGTFPMTPSPDHPITPGMTPAPDHPITPGTEYLLDVESGPKRRTTMVHVTALPGCVATGPTTEAALAATPDAIRAFLRFLRGHGEAADPDAPFTARVAEHLTEGRWMGQGSPYVLFASDRGPVTGPEIAAWSRRHGWLLDDLADLAAGDLAPYEPPPGAKGRPAREVLLHVLGAAGPSLSAATGSAPGFSRLHGAATRGEIDLAVALRQCAELAVEQVVATTPEQRAGIRDLPTHQATLRKALRRMAGHPWEHRAELLRRTESRSRGVE